MFYFRIFIALGLTFTSMIYLELIIVYIARDKLKWIFFLGGREDFSIVPVSFIENSYVSY